MSIYKDFSSVTRASLTHALSDLSLPSAAIDSLMRAYDSLDLNPDAGPGLISLQSSTAIDAYIFSNGSPAMLKASVTKSLSLAQFQGIFQDIAGLKAAWVDRQGLGWIDGLGELVGGKGPTVVVRGVDEAVREIQRQEGDRKVVKPKN
ncbi:hypothetical protein VC83_04583 [Pseudogymnoascus destructans]|uniref:Uncharacterized protein n=1 Tax=Pseudogymnoascus destructans TaxID=655981 RepID=A0A177A4U9_9PEZI|nr:uncharacterized protein VC83_04583 [Pseudogymnoascus destructans]OAF57289.1 hypothetical protein VC83_04583 [Pseudogymnoascus destructans]